MLEGMLGRRAWFLPLDNGIGPAFAVTVALGADDGCRCACAAARIGGYGRRRLSRPHNMEVLEGLPGWAGAGPLYPGNVSCPVAAVVEICSVSPGAAPS